MIHTRSYVPLILLLVFLFPVHHMNAADRNLLPGGLRWPVDVTRYLTSSFGERRPDRFHAGIDFSTGGVGGRECYAVADGSVTRLKVRHLGYGKALYLTLEDGRIAVYAHLDRFHPKIEELVRQEQLARGGYELELFFKRGEFSFKQGEVIAWSGGTGSGPPHLHFEMRDRGNHPYNPAHDGFVPHDSRPPNIRRLALRPLDGGSEVEGDMGARVLPVMQGRTDTLRVFGTVGLSAEIIDYQDGARYRLAPDRIELYLDDSLRHVTELNTFSYSVNHHARLELDYELERMGYPRFRRLYLHPSNRLPFYDRALSGGRIDTRELSTGAHELSVVAWDAAGNRSQALMPVLVLSQPTLPPADSEEKPVKLHGPAEPDSTLELQTELIGTTIRFEAYLPSDSAWSVQVQSDSFESPRALVQHEDGRWVGRGELPIDLEGVHTFWLLVADEHGVVRTRGFSRFLKGFAAGEINHWNLDAEGVELIAGNGDLWHDMVIAAQSMPSDNTLASVIAFEPRLEPMQRPVTIRFRSDDGPWDERAVVVYREMEDHAWQFLGHTRDESGRVLAAQAYSLEQFSVALDSIPPWIGGYTLRDGAYRVKQQPWLSVRVDDNLSGVDLEAVEFLLDGEPVIWRYDPDEARLEYTPWTPLSAGRHTWEITIHDRVGNPAGFKREFRVH